MQGFICAEGEVLGRAIVRIYLQLGFVNRVAPVHREETIPEEIESGRESADEAIGALIACPPGIGIVRADGVVVYIPIGRESVRVEDEDRVAAPDGIERIDESGVERPDVCVHVVFERRRIPCMGDRPLGGLKRIDERFAQTEAVGIGLELIGLTNGEMVLVHDRVTTVRSLEVHTDIRNFVGIGDGGARVPYFFLEDSSAYGVAMVVGMVIADEIIDRNNLEGLDVEVELEDRVTSVGRLVIDEISTCTVDDLSAPLDGIAGAAFVRLNEMIGRMDDDMIGDERVASFGCQQQVRCIDDDIVLLDPPIGRRGVELDGIAEIVTMRIAEDIHVCLFARVVVADVESDGIVITRSDTQREVVNRVAVMDGSMHERVPIGGVGFKNLIARQRVLHFRSGVMLALPGDGVVIADLNRVVEIVRRIQSQPQDMHGVASALSVLILYGALLRLERVNIGISGVADTLRGYLITHDIALALYIPDA